MKTTKAAQQLQHLGAPPEVIERVLAKERNCLILPENEKAVFIFLMVQTQWLIAPNGKPYGLNYNSLFEVLKVYDIKKAERAEVFAGIKVIEHEAIRIINGVK